MRSHDKPDAAGFRSPAGVTIVALSWRALLRVLLGGTVEVIGVRVTRLRRSPRVWGRS